jgi:predicted transcriptional regulator
VAVSKRERIAREDGGGAGPAREGAPRLHDTIRLSAEGLAKVLGDLEARVLRTIWRLGRPSSARAVHERIAREHDVAPLTTVTVLNKLVAKGVLARRKQGYLFHYSARLNESEFMAFASRRVVTGILSFGPDAVAASLVDVLAEQDPARLAELGRLVTQRLRGVAPDGAETARGGDTEAG